MIIKIYENQDKECNKDKQHYISHYGEHFNEKLCDFAIAKIAKYNEAITPLSKNLVDKLLAAYNITLDNNKLYDYIYVANLGKANYYGNSITDELHLAQFIKDMLDANSKGLLFHKWLLEMNYYNIDIDWQSMCD